MIFDLIRAGFRLSGRSDPRVARGLAWATLEGLLAAAPYPLLHVLVQDVFSDAATPSRILLIGLGMAACLALRTLAAARALPLLFAGAYALMGEARLRLADHLRRLPMGWFNRQRDGDLSARLTSDLDLVEHLWSHFLGVFFGGLAMPLFLLAWLFWLDARLALLVCLSLPPAWLALVWAQRLLARPGEQMLAAGAQAQSALLEYVQGIAVLRGFGRFGPAWQRLQQVLKAQMAAMLAAESRPAPGVAAFGFLLESGYLLLVLAGIGWLGQDLDTATLVAFLILALPIYRQLFEVGLSTLMLRFAHRSLTRIEALLAEAQLPEPAHPLPPQGHDIVFEKVGFAYTPGEPVLEALSCVIPAGGLTAVVGPSGAGKSTLVHLIARLWDVEAGSIRLGGVDLRDIGSECLHQQVAMVFQDVWLFSGSVLDNLRIGRPDASREAAMAAARRARAHDFIMALPQGYDTPLDEGGASLSGGERQRLSIARALLKDAPVLLLDEATASVDPSAEADIQRAIGELARGRTVVVIAHRLKNVRHANNILVLDGGCLVAQGTHAQLLAHDGVYRRLWARQMHAD